MACARAPFIPRLEGTLAQTGRLESRPAQTLALICGLLGWLFVFGDNPWPRWSGPVIAVVAVTAFVVLLAAQLMVAWSVGKQQESKPHINRTHVAVAIVSTLTLAAFVAIRFFAGQAPQSDSERCAALCRDQGAFASGMPPRDSGDRTCSCYDENGREVRRSELPER